ncbi:hypothetical protein ACJRO7_000581 [Eucalyptus globulus]|uniref:F-box domain-containing protein n=1 Tax=Eucalyptus globulus TaxID=34317 RepID=A0ABD3LS96_EUCGL
MTSFPIDVLMEIFLCVSAKPLVRFRCVCKSWNSLITNPFFIKAYLERSIKLHRFDLLKYDFNNLSRVQIRYSPKNELSSNLDNSFVGDGEKFKLVGACNGIVCLSTFDCKNPHHSKIFLWNPSTGENRALPQPSLRVSNLVGFGFDSSSGHPDDFKVVNVNIRFEEYSNYTSQVEVYGFRRNCWKQVGNIFPPVLTQHLRHQSFCSIFPSSHLGHQVIFENFICWCPVFCVDNEIVTLLIIFDVVQDVFRQLPFPAIMPPAEKHINLLDGCLSVIAHNSSTNHYEVWFMKEFGVCESWTKLYTIGSIENCWPVGFANSGEVFFLRRLCNGLRYHSPIQCVLYNVGSEDYKEFGVEVDSLYSTQLVPYIESLISLSSTNNAEH